MSTDEIVAGVMDLFPAADRQALRCLADLMAKQASEDCSALRTENARLREALKEARDHIDRFGLAGIKRDEALLARLEAPLRDCR